jgi:hypothetical protein
MRHSRPSTLDPCRPVDQRPPMTNAPAPARHRQIVGISLPPEIATKFKQEAARRGVSVRKLFLEMWDAYQAPDAK